MQDLDLFELLNARRGVVCAIGAGGKKTTLYALASRHPGRVGVTTTVQLPPFPGDLPGARVIATAADMLEQVVMSARRERIVAFAHPSEQHHRIGGVHPELLAEIQARAGFDLLLIKADGAKRKPLKAPAAYEPVIPDFADTVLVLLSAGVLGKVLDEGLAHRIERVEAVTGARRGERLQPEHLARLLVSEQGYMKGIDDAHIIPIINQVDDEPHRQLAIRTARLALAQTTRFDRVILASMKRAEIVDVVDG